MEFAKNNIENRFFNEYSKNPKIKLIPNNTNTNCKILIPASNSGFIE